jgi:hypothetical protein
MVVHLLLNTIEHQAARIEDLERKVEELESELKRLKTGQGKPPKGDPKNPQPRAGQPKDTEVSPNKNHKKGPKNEKIAIDREQKLDIPQEQLPPDAVFKGYRDVVVQNVLLKRDNVLYQVAQYYSPSEGKLYSAPVPGYVGEFGAELQAILQTLHNVCDVTQGSLEKLLASVGVQISSGTVNNILHSQSPQVQAEQKDILRAGLESSPYADMDGTKSFEKGKRLSTQIICGEFFTVFQTLPGKTRLDILCALQGTDRNGLLLQHNEITAHWLGHFKVGAKNRKLLEKLFKDRPPLKMEDFIGHLDAAAPKLVDSAAFERIADAFALGHYHARTDWPVLQLLMSDQGREYACVPVTDQALCWLHDERHYRLLNPKVAFHQQVLDRFLGEYWTFYRQLLDFKELPPAQQEQQKTGLEEGFDRIFAQKTNFDNLDKQIQKTLAKKDNLLLVLKYPFLPLHNNAAELAVRAKVRKRDISLHTMSELGTKTQDAFMTVVHTAGKLGVSAFDYIADRVSRRFQMTPLADLVRKAYTPVTL